MSKIEDINSIDGDITDCDPAGETICEDAETPELTLFANSESAGSSSEPDIEDKGEQGYAVYEPPALEGDEEEWPSESSVETEIEYPEEWLVLSEGVMREYGDTLTGTAGYMGPVGMLLTVVSSLILLFHLWIKISSIVLVGSAAGFIIGIFLMLFHATHWISNRSKGRRLALLTNEKLFGRPCSHLNIDVEDNGNSLSIHCAHFDMEISQAPECVVCDSYIPRENGTNSGSVETVDDEDDGAFSTTEIDEEIDEEFQESSEN